MEETNSYTLISSNEERLYIFGAFVLGSAGFVIAFGIFWRLQNIFKSLQDLSEEESNTNYYYHLAVRTTQISVFCSMFVYLLQIFFSNNLLIPWNYEENSRFMTIFDALVMTFWFCGKMVYYFSFTYHIQAIFDELMSLSLKIWMILMALSLMICCFAIIVSDASIFDESEIGITEGHNFNIGVPDTQSDVFQITSPVMTITDIIYFGILLFIYISKLRKVGGSARDNKNDHDPSTMIVQSVKGIVLISSSCLIYWIFLISLFTDSDIKHVLLYVDIIFDDICLYLMFTENNDLYQSLCCCLHPFCTKMIVGKAQYQAVSNDEMNN